MSNKIITISPRPDPVRVGALIRQLAGFGVVTDADNIEITADSITIIYTSTNPDAEDRIREVVESHNPPEMETEEKIVRDLALAAHFVPDPHTLQVRALGLALNAVNSQERALANLFLGYLLTQQSFRDYCQEQNIALPDPLIILSDADATAWVMSLLQVVPISIPVDEEA